jgi:starch phosphorylase
MLDYSLWNRSHHNPVKLLREIVPERLAAAAKDPAFLLQYEAVMKAFDTDLLDQQTWYAHRYPELAQRPVAYFSFEFGLHTSLPAYAGGLGILAGDHCKEAGTLGLPLVGVGFMYPQGYFHQHITADGWQQSIYEQLEYGEAPVQHARTPQGEPCLIQVPLNGRQVHVAVWRVQVGRVPLYLMDTNVEENEPWDRELSARLYGGDQTLRIQQEIVLGIGGVRVLRALGLDPAVWHVNEGHSAFMMLERVREFVQQGRSFKQAADAVRATTIFTTHTPVPAGHDAFPFQLVEEPFSHYWESLGLERDQFLQLGAHQESWGEAFNMTVLALHLAGYRNGVSRLHGQVTRKMWRSVWPEVPEDQVPITSVTNGVHVPTWIAQEMDRLYEKHLGRDWVTHHDDPALWERVLEISDDELWAVRQQLKRKLISFIRERVRWRWIRGQATPEQVLAAGTLLDPEALTIGFARRFATYKRAALIFQDMARLKRILQNPWRPVQIIFAGKAHPADEPGQRLIHQVYNLAKDESFGGQIAFLEDYDMHVARYLVQGVDIWLNTPRPPREASGTSGQKAALNGIPHLSILDGWWYEGYNGANGWAIGDGQEHTDCAARDQADAQSLYRLLEEEVVPLFYTRDRDDVPRGWMRVVKEAIRTCAPKFSARRMVKEYADLMYAPAARCAPPVELKQQTTIASGS